MKKIAALKQGDTIGIMAPSDALSPYERRKLAKGVARLESQGFRVEVHPQTFAVHGDWAGTPQQKADALHELYADPRIRAIFAAAGGSGAIETLDLLDYGLIAANPKIIMGYSDVTAPLHAIHEKTGQVTFHGPTVISLGRNLQLQHLAQGFNLLAGNPSAISMRTAAILKPGKAEGSLFGGNLTRFSEMVDAGRTPPVDGAILFFEDLGETPAYYSRMLGNLHDKGVLGRAAGLVFGTFTHNIGSGSRSDDRSLKDVLRNSVKDLEIPVVFNAPFGHGAKLCVLPVGGRASLTAQPGSAPVLALDGPAVTL